jgi:hypothetical protein
MFLKSGTEHHFRNFRHGVFAPGFSFEKCFENGVLSPIVVLPLGFVLFPAFCGLSHRAGASSLACLKCFLRPDAWLAQSRKKILDKTI